MTGRQLLLVAVVAVNGEPGEAIHAFELLEAIEWNLAGTSNELQQLGLLFLVKAANRSPEPLHLWRSRCVVRVFGVVLPVIDVDIW